MSGVAVLFCLFLAVRGLALDPARSLSQYNVQTWTRHNGLPANSINAIAQTKDGYLWLGTPVGLVRFDGTAFKPLPLAGVPGVRNGIVSSLASAREGGLWVGMENSAFGFHDGEAFSFLGKKETGGQGFDVRSILESEDGAVWIAGDADTARITRDGLYQTVLHATDLMRFNTVGAFQDSQGRVWLGTANQGVLYWQAGKLAKLTDPTAGSPVVHCFAEDADGQIFIGTQFGLFRYATSLEQQESLLEGDEIRALLTDRHGALWIGTSGNGLFRLLNGEMSSIRITDGLAGGAVRALAEDREGSIWVGTTGGLSQVTDAKFLTQPVVDDSHARAVIAVGASPRGGVWAAHNEGVTYIDGRTAPKLYSTESGLPSASFKRVFEASNGDVYIVGGSSTLLILSGGKVVAEHQAENMVVGMAEDAHGVVVSVGGKLFRAGKDDLTPYPFPEGNAPQMNWILNLVTGRDGALWVSSVSGIFRIKDGAYQQWTVPMTKEGVSGVMWLCEDSDGVIWGGLLSGIARLKGNEVRVITRDQGLLDSNIYAIVPDHFGNLWVDSGRGIFRVSRKSMNDCADGIIDRVECVAYDSEESVKPADKTNQERLAAMSTDGRIWFPGARGVVVVDPANIPVNLAAPQVHIDRIRANGREIARGGTIEVPPGRGELEIHFTALSFIAPQKVRVRYRLEGYDTDWVESSGRRMTIYTNLKAGRYNFRVTAANADGVWNETGAALAIQLRPHFYETTWFHLVCGVMVLGGLAGVYRWRIRFLKRKEQALLENRLLLEAEVRTRTADLQSENTERKRAEAGLANSLSVLNATLDSTLDGIMVVDREGKVKHFNRRFAELWRVTPEQLASGNNRSVLGSVARQLKDPRGFIRQSLELFTDPEAEKSDVIEFNDGRILELYTRPQSFDGVSAGRVWCFRDITERKRIEAEITYERDLFQVLLDSLPDLIYFKDRESRFVRFSRAFAARFQLSDHESIRGKTDFDFFDISHAQPAFDDEQEIMRTGEPIVGKLEQENYANGTVTWVLTTKMPWRDGDGAIVGTFGISKDVTEWKETENKLAATHELLLKTSRQAGMAEVATGVLHNVGNVLNSVNVSTDVLRQTLRSSEVKTLTRVASLLQEHSADMDEFLTASQKGRLLPGVVIQLARRLEKEHATLNAEQEHLSRNVEHIKSIVAMQQNFATVSGVLEKVRLADLLRDVLQMHAVSFVRHGIEVIREYEDLPETILDRHKVTQILVNLVANAKHAIDEARRADGRITVRVARNGSDRARISIADNGVGIEAGNITKIFAHGFTTRTNGHGFGLHSGANAAREMGGSIQVESDGPGLGAVFTVELPFNPKTSAA